jgi:hypothetical protein
MQKLYAPQGKMQGKFPAMAKGKLHSVSYSLILAGFI